MRRPLRYELVPVEPSGDEPRPAMSRHSRHASRAKTDVDAVRVEAFGSVLAAHVLENPVHVEFFVLADGRISGSGLFTARFLVQWLASEKERAVVVPSAFWWLSMVGGAALLSYAIHRRDPVIIVGQSMGLFVYARNLMLEAKKRKRAEGRRSAFGLARPRSHFPGSGGRIVKSPLQRGGRSAIEPGRDADGSARM